MDKRFVHRGIAVGLSGSLVRVDNDRTGWTIPAQASSAVTVSGGEASAQVKRYVFSITKPRTAQLVVAKNITTSVTSRADLAANTSRADVQATVEGLTIDGGFSTGTIRAQLASAHTAADKIPVITTGDCLLPDLKLGNSVLGVELDLDTFRECGTTAKLNALYKRSKTFRQYNYRRFNTPEDATEILRQRSGVYVVSLVKSLTWKTAPHPDVTLDGYTVIWKGFGRIHLGEMLVSDYYRRLTMIRFEFGSPMEGPLSIGDVETNGNFMP